MNSIPNHNEFEVSLRMLRWTPATKKTGLKKEVTPVVY